MIFKPTSPTKIIAQQRYEAERLRLEHAAAAEAHQAASKNHAQMAEMYAARINRLDQLKEAQQ